MKKTELARLALLALRLRAGLKRTTGKAGAPVLLFRIGGIGDVVCAFPAAEGLRRQFPDSPLVFATYAAYRPLVEMAGCADAFLEADWARPLLRVYERLFSRVYHPRIEDETPTGLPLVHMVDDFCRKVGVLPPSRQPRLTVGAADRARLRAEVEGVRRGGGPVLALHAGPSWPVRSWPQAAWERLAERLIGEGATLIQVGADAHLKESVRAIRVAGATDWVGRFSLAETVGVLAVCDGFVGIDSGLLHVAGAVGTPSVGLFGPTAPALRLPPETPSRAVTSDVPCLGCHHRHPALHWVTGCPYDIACMRGITPEQVYEAVQALLRSEAI